MALITCPECGKEISDKSEKCIHCGYPINKAVQKENFEKYAGYICDSCGEGFDIPYSNTNLYYSSDKQEYICPNCGKPMWYLMSSIINTATNKVVDEFFDESRNIGHKKLNQQNTPKCPTCGSTNLSKVSAISKIGSVAMFGIFSQKVKKTWHCNDCKYEW